MLIINGGIRPSIGPMTGIKVKMPAKREVEAANGIPKTAIMNHVISPPKTPQII